MSKQFISIFDNLHHDKNLSQYKCSGYDKDFLKLTKVQKAAMFFHRNILHNKIANNFFNGKVPPIGRNPIYTIMLGPPGVGKTTYVKNLLCNKSNNIKPNINCDKTFIYLNLDEIIIQLPEFHNCINYKAQYSIKECASGDFCYKEAFYIFETYILERALNEKYDIIFDTTGGNIFNIVNILNLIKIKNLHYDIICIYINVSDINNAIVRTIDRSKLEGRIVDESYLRHVFGNVDANFIKLINQINRDSYFNNTIIYKCKNDGPYSQDYSTLKQRCTQIHNPLINPIYGGNIDYKQKYLKYKKKYLEYKKNSK